MNIERERSSVCFVFHVNMLWHGKFRFSVMAFANFNFISAKDDKKVRRAKIEMCEKKEESILGGE